MLHTGPPRALRATTPRYERGDVSDKRFVPVGVFATYLLFSSPSSMNVAQYPVGFAVVARLITVIFIVVS